MPHGGPHQRTTTFNKPKTDTRPKGMPSFLSYSQPKQKTSQPEQKTSQPEQKTKHVNPRINIINNKNNKNNKKDDFLTVPSDNTKFSNTLDIDGNVQRDMTNEERNVYQTKVNKRFNQKEWVDEKAPIFNIFNQPIGGIVTNTFLYNWNKNKEYFNNKVNEGRKEWISPDEPWYQKKLKDMVITTLTGIQATGMAGMETGIDLTLKPAGVVSAVTMATGNEIIRDILNMNVSDKEEILDTFYEPAVYGSIALMESTGFGAMKMPPVARLGLKSEALFLSKKIPYEFNNIISKILVKEKVPFNFNNSVKQINKTIREKQAKNMVVDGDFVVMEAAMKDPIVKKEIKQLQIQGLEHALATKKGNIIANNIANHLRVTNNINPVAPLKTVQAKSLSSAATTKEDIYKLKEPFFNALERVTESLPVNEFNQIKVKDLKDALVSKKQLQRLEIRKIERPMKLTKFDDFIANLDANNITNVDKATVTKYLKDNPITLSIDIGENVIPPKLIEKKSVAENIKDTSWDTVDFIIEEASSDLPILRRSVPFPSKDIQKYHGALKETNAPLQIIGGSGMVNPSINAPSVPDPSTNNHLFKDVAHNTMTFYKEFDGQFSLKEFEEGWMPLSSRISKNIPITYNDGTRQSKKIVFTKSNIMENYKNKIMYNLGFEYKWDTERRQKTWIPISPNEPSGQSQLWPNFTSKQLETGTKWVSTIIDNFNNRPHFNEDYPHTGTPEGEIIDGQPITFEQSIGFVAQPPKIADIGMVWHNQPISVEVLTRIANQSKYNRNGAPNSLYSTNMSSLNNMLNTLVYDLALKDIPEWPLFVKSLKTYEKFPTGPNEKHTQTFQKSLDAVQNSNTELFEINKAIESTNKPFVYPYKYSKPYAGGMYEGISKTYGHVKYDKYFELKLTSNDLTGYPTFGDEGHFQKVPNIISWSTNNVLNINKTPINPQGDSMMVAQEIQSINPTTEMGGKGNKGSFLYGSMTKRPIQKNFELNTVNPTANGHEIVSGKEIDKDLLIDYFFSVHRPANLINEVTRASIIEKAQNKNFIKIPNAWTQQKSFELGYTIIPTDSVWYTDQPIYTVVQKKNKDNAGQLLGYYQKFSDQKYNPNDDGAMGGDIIANVNLADQMSVRESGDLPNFDPYKSETDYLQTFSKEAGIQEQREMGYGGIGDANWYQHTLWAMTRYAFDNGFDFLSIPTNKSIKKHWRNQSGGNYNNYIQVLDKMGFNVISDKVDGEFVGVPMEDWGHGAPASALDIPGSDVILEQQNIEYLNDNVGDDKIHIIDLRDRDSVFDILNKPRQSSSLIDQTNQLLSTFA